MLWTRFQDEVRTETNTIFLELLSDRTIIIWYADISDNRFTNSKDSRHHKNMFHISRYSIPYHLAMHDCQYDNSPWCTISIIQNRKFVDIENLYSYTDLYMFFQILHGSLENTHRTCKYCSSCWLLVIWMILSE